ncbi:MAG: HNH endonuclease, partial [Verrucomicrobiota bacterium]
DKLPKQEIKLTRQNIFLRDRHVCQYCGKEFPARDLNIDHVIPRDKGGEGTWENLVCSCVRCNTRKANKLPAEARMFPIQEPRKPRWRPFHGYTTGRQELAHESWRHFIDPARSQVSVSS